MYRILRHFYPIHNFAPGMSRTTRQELSKLFKSDRKVYWRQKSSFCETNTDVEEGFAYV